MCSIRESLKNKLFLFRNQIWCWIRKNYPLPWHRFRVRSGEWQGFVSQRPSLQAFEKISKRQRHFWRTGQSPDQKTATCSQRCLRRHQKLFKNCPKFGKTSQGYVLQHVQAQTRRGRVIGKKRKFYFYFNVQKIVIFS